MSQTNAGTAYCVGTLDEFPLGEFTIVMVGSHEVGLVRVSEEIVCAVRNVCPHRGAPVCRGTIDGTMLPSAPGELQFGFENRILACPWHGYEFDVTTGEAMFSDLKLRLRTYPVTVRGDKVYVTVRSASRNPPGVREREQEEGNAS